MKSLEEIWREATVYDLSDNEIFPEELKMLQSKLGKEWRKFTADFTKKDVSMPSISNLSLLGVCDTNWNYCKILDCYYKEYYSYIGTIVKSIYLLDTNIGLSLINEDLYPTDGAEFIFLNDNKYILLNNDNYISILNILKEILLNKIISYFKNNNNKFIIPIYIYPSTGEYFCGGANHWSIKLYKLLRECGVDSYLCSPTHWKTPKNFETGNLVFINSEDINCDNDILISLGNYKSIACKKAYLYFSSNQFYESSDKKVLYIHNMIAKENNPDEYYISNKYINKLIVSFPCEKILVVNKCINDDREIKISECVETIPFMNNFPIGDFHEQTYVRQSRNNKFILIYNGLLYKIDYNIYIDTIREIKTENDFETFVDTISRHYKTIDLGSKENLKSYEHVILAFKDCGLFITSNYSTYLSFIAVLFGMDSVVITDREKIPYNIPLYGVKYGFNDKIDFEKERSLLVEHIQTQNKIMLENCCKLLIKIYFDIRVKDLS